MVQEIEVSALAQMRREGAAHLVLDVREPQEVQICVITDSLCIPMQEIPGQLHRLPQDRPLVVLCHHGARSARVTAYLQQNGFDNALNLAGGIDAWARLVESDIRRY